MNSDAATLVEQLRQKRGLDGVFTENRMVHTQEIRSAVERIRTAMTKQEHIGIFGDYDCDGVVAVSLLVRFFHRHDIKPYVRLPHRVQDGYGLHAGIVQELKNAGVTLLITADTGMSSAPEISALKTYGIDTVVTDHHTIPEHMPPAVATVHPALMTGFHPPYPSGAGVVYRLLEALEEGPWKGMETDTALAMVGMIADLVELKGENRLLVQQGLQALRHLGTSTPLARLTTIAGLKLDRVTSTDVAFRLAPRINASGRMDDPMIALQALLGNEEALEKLDVLNRARQQETETLVQAARESLGINKGMTNVLPPLIALAAEEYPHGIIGLIAGKLTEETGHPSMVATADGEQCVASLRSPPCYHVTEGLTRCSDLLEQFGGHAQAAGCTLKQKHWGELCRRMVEDVRERTDADALQPTLTIDAELRLEDISLDLLRTLARLEPYGEGNREPLFLLRDVSLDLPRCIGRERNHLQCTITGRKTIGFRLGHLIPQCAGPLDIACRIALDEWQGYQQPQIVIEDMRRSNSRFQIPKTKETPIHNVR